MKHGDKKAKSAKASVKKASPKGPAQKSGKAIEVKTGGKKQSSTEAKGGSSGKAGSAAARDSGIRPARASGDAGSFGNSALANAFKRAVKKYPNAFRRLTD